MKLDCLPALQRPREKALLRGVNSLSDAELLAIILKTGNKYQSVLELATQLLLKHGGLYQLFHTSFHELIKENGINKVKALDILAIQELWLRITRYKDYQNHIVLKNHQDVYSRYFLELVNLKQEKFFCIYLNIKNEIIKEEMLFAGGETYASIEPKIIIKNALNYHAQKLFLLHNHPSGDPVASNADIQITKKIYMCAQLFQIEVIEHLIVGNCKYYAVLEKKLYII